MLTFPPEISAPEQDSYSFDNIEVVDRTEGDQGYMRARPTALIAPTMFEVMWVCTSEEWNVINNFHRISLRNGADKFLWPCYTGKDFFTQEAQFAAAPSHKYAGFQHFNVKAKLYVNGTLGPVLWANLGIGEIGEVLTLATLSDFRITRVDIDTRIGFDGTTPIVYVGSAPGGGVTNEYVNGVAVGTSGERVTIIAGSAHAGTDMDTNTAGPADIKVKLEAGTSTVGDVAVIVTYESTVGFAPG